MNKQDLETLLIVLDASIMKGGIIAPDAMLAVSTARARAKSLMEQMSPSEELKSEMTHAVIREAQSKEVPEIVYDVNKDRESIRNTLRQTDKPSESKK